MKIEVSKCSVETNDDAVVIKTIKSIIPILLGVFNLCKTIQHDSLTTFPEKRVFFDSVGFSTESLENHGKSHRKKHLNNYGDF